MPGTAVVESALCLFGSGSPTEALIGSPRDFFGCIWDTKSFWADGEQCHLELPVHGDTGELHSWRRKARSATGKQAVWNRCLFLECICTDVLLIQALRGCLVMHFLGFQIKPTHLHVCFRPSSILLSCGIPCDVAQNALRLSVGRDTTRADVDLVVQDLVQAVAQLGKDQAS